MVLCSRTMGNSMLHRRQPPLSTNSNAPCALHCAHCADVFTAAVVHCAPAACAPPLR
jgi:hypothetical protein